jgi:hypothetical protein
MSAKGALLRSLVVILCVLLGAPALVEAGDRDETRRIRQARKHKQAGLKHLKRKRLERAIEELEIAYGLSQEPVLLFHLGEAYNARQAYPQALYYYREYRDHDPRGARKRKVDVVIDALVALQPPEPEPPPPAEPEPEPPPLIVAPSPPQPAQRATPRAEIAAVATRQAPGPASDPGRGRRLTGLAVGGVGFALLGGGAYFGKVAGDRADEISDLFARGATWDDAYDRTYDEGRAARRNALILSGVGGAAVVTGAVLYYLGHRAGVARHLEVAGLPGGVQLGVAWDL